jgi:hypothetical protein
MFALMYTDNKLHSLIAVQAFVLFIKKEAGVYEMNLGCPGIDFCTRYRNKAYPDLVIGVPVF